MVCVPQGSFYFSWFLQQEGSLGGSGPCLQTYCIENHLAVTPHLNSLEAKQKQSECHLSAAKRTVLSPDARCLQQKGEIQLLTATILTSKLLSLPLCVSEYWNISSWRGGHVLHWPTAYGCTGPQLMLELLLGEEMVERKTNKMHQKTKHKTPWRLCIFKKPLFWKEKYLFTKSYYLQLHFYLHYFVSSEQGAALNAKS